MPASFIRTAAMITGLLATASPIPGSADESKLAAQAGRSTLPRYEARFGRSKPVIAVVAYNPATEITDFVVPYGVLAESGVGEVLAVTTSAGPIQTTPTLRFGGHATLSEFDARHPQGADYVIVPKLFEGEDDLPLRAWLRKQAAQGGIVVGICDGVPTLAKAGLLEGKRATTHWRTIDRMEREHPGTRWLRNTRYIADGRIITTSGVSASIPISIALVEAIAGRERAEALGRQLGATAWSPRHNSLQFRLTPAFFLTALANKAMLWRHEDLGIDVAAGADEIRVALMADAWSRTRRSMAYTVAASSEPVMSQRGLLIYPDRVAGKPPATSRTLPLMASVRPVQALDRALEAIATDYGGKTAEFVALSMEYEWRSPQVARKAESLESPLPAAQARTDW
jgi:transcriptional regulator GlxA family with amidase domain